MKAYNIYEDNQSVMDKDTDDMIAPIAETTYGCDDCPKLKKSHCSVWEIKINDPHNSSCDSIRYWINQSK